MIQIYSLSSEVSSPIARCLFCLQDDHTATHCPHNPNRPYFGWFPDPAAWLAYLPPTHLQQTKPPVQVQEICRRFNKDRCKHQKCKYRHVCSTCQGAHTAIDCPSHAQGQGTGRSRSPLRAPIRGTTSQLAPCY